jgi:hypothetical protein
MTNSKIRQFLTKVGKVASQWEFYIISPESFCGIVMFVMEVPLQSCILDFTLYTTHIYPYEDPILEGEGF